jgi:hypothetical protein
MLGGGAIAALAFLIVAASPPWPVQLAAFLVLVLAFIRCTAQFRWRQRSFRRERAVPPPRCIRCSFLLGHATGPVFYGLAFARLGPGLAVALGGLSMLFVGAMTARTLGRPRPPPST